jgi:hypothetical protein
MTIDPDVTSPAAEHAAEFVRFVFGSELAGSLLDGARAMLSAAPSELAESFEQAVHACGLAA